MSAEVFDIPRADDRAAAGPLAFIDRLLRDQGAFLDELEDETQHAAIARTLIVTIVASSAAFGATLGAFRLLGRDPSSIQVVYNVLKFPLVVLLTAALAAPVLSALSRAIAGRTSITRDLLLVLSALALGTLSAAALAPAVLLVMLGGFGYHATILAAVGACGAGGAFGLSLFVRGLLRSARSGWFLVGAASLAVFALVGSHMAWTFRPYIVRPRTRDVPFIRSIEDGFFDSVARTSRSARGIYVRDEAPLPERDGEQR